MKNEKIYDDWKKQRNHVEPGHNFTDQVMNQVNQYEQNKRKPLFDMQWLIEFISEHTLAKATLVAAGLVAGFIRMVFTVYMFLGT